jgi:hypothetical protein
LVDLGVQPVDLLVQHDDHHGERAGDGRERAAQLGRLGELLAHAARLSESGSAQRENAEANATRMAQQQNHAR